VVHISIGKAYSTYTHTHTHTQKRKSAYNNSDGRSEGENTIWEQRTGREENNIKNGLKMYTGFI
jgi:hypothetical protein